MCGFRYPGGAGAGSSVNLVGPPLYRVFLVGDSTTQAGCGYGKALCARFSAQVSCSNRAVGGGSSESYRVDGYWGRMIAALKEAAAIAANNQGGFGACRSCGGVTALLRATRVLAAAPAAGHVCESL